MRYVIIFICLVAVYAIGWLFGAASRYDFCAGTLHIDKNFDYMWQFEFDDDSSLSKCKECKFIYFRVDKEANLASQKIQSL